MLNWSMEVFGYLLAVGISTICLTLTFRLFAQYQAKSLKFLLYCVIFETAFAIIGVFQYLYLSKLLFIIQGVMVVPIGLTMIISADYLRNYRVNPVNFLLFGICLTGYFIYLFDPNNTVFMYLSTGEPTLKPTLIVQIWGSLTLLLIYTMYFYSTLLILKNCSKDLKKKAYLTVVGGFIFGPLTFLIYILRIVNIVPGIVPVLSTIGMLLVSISFKKEPYLVQVLIETTKNAKLRLIEQYLPICAHCKKIRIEKNEWIPIEDYFRKESQIAFSHCVCPSCLEIHYSGLDL